MRLTSLIFTSLAIGWTGNILAQNASFSNGTSNVEVEQNYFLLNSPFGILKNKLAAQVLELPTGTCNSETPCVNGACCSIVSDYPKDIASMTNINQQSGLCGYSPAECGAGNCSSNCFAKAECGQYGAPGKQNCPLGVCCSKFGFCGSVAEFCDADQGCQKDFGGCGDVKRPSCSKDGGSVDNINVGYYESWANTRKCSSVSPEDLNLDGFTHLNFAFVFFHPTTFEIVPMDKNAGELLSRFTALKEKKSGLQTWVSVGGWSFNDPGPWQLAFSNMASTAANRKTFINNMMQFMDTYGFDGMDLDWEYPTADDRGGKAEDSANFVQLSKDIHDQFAGRYGYTITLPSSYWYLKHFELAKHQPSVDWFNLMSYDLHGVWDAASKFIGPKIAPHTNITEIDLGLDLLWRAGVKPEKVVMGKGYYGRSFTLTDPNCNKPDGTCTFSGGAKEGPCSGASGILTLQEIKEIIKNKDLKPVHDQKAGVKWIQWDNDQWVSYDDEDTFKQKREFANSRCLGGLMVWAIDQVDQKEKSLNYPPDFTEEEIMDAELVIQDEAAQGTCFTTQCGAKCNGGEFEAAQMNGQPGDLSVLPRCQKGEFRRLCCAKGTVMGKCRWRGYRGVGLSCLGGCGEGETEVTANTNHHSDEEDQTCAGGTQSYCCLGFKPPITKEQVQETIKDEAKDFVLEAAEAAALELAATAFCRIAITAALTPLTFIPVIGWIIRLAVQAAVPALAKLCAKGIAKSGKSVFKFRGKDYDVKLDKPLTSKKDREPSATPTKPSGRDGKCTRKNQKRAQGRTLSVTDTTYMRDVEVVRRQTCDFATGGQACLHYRSVIREQGNGYASLTCTDKLDPIYGGPLRPVVAIYNGQHNNGWIHNWMHADPLNNLEPPVCQRDEWPPAAIWQGRNLNQWIRLSPRDGNGKAGSLWRGMCPDKVSTRSIGVRLTSVQQACNRVIEHYEETAQRTVTVMHMDFTRIPAGIQDDGLLQNPCYPKDLVEDPGFALLWTDPWYQRAGNTNKRPLRAQYAQAPLPGITNGKTPTGLTKRGLLDPREIVVDTGNSSRRATDEELLEDFGLIQCEGDCKKEMNDFGFASLPVLNHELVVPQKLAEACPTPATTYVTVTAPSPTGASLPTTTMVARTASRVLSAISSIITEGAEYAFWDGEVHDEEEDCE